MSTMERPPSSTRRSSKRHAGRRKKHRMDAVSLIKLLRKHSTLTLTVSVVLVSLLMGYMAIEMGA